MNINEQLLKSFRDYRNFFGTPHTEVYKRKEELRKAREAEINSSIPLIAQAPVEVNYNERELLRKEKEQNVNNFLVLNLHI